MGVNNYIKIAIRSFLMISVLFLCAFFVSCDQKSTSRYPASLDKAIELFFIENRNDSVLKLLENEELKDQPLNIRSVSDIFKAAALSETGRADSARQILQNVHNDQLYGRDLYYYLSINGLTQFRLNKFQQSYQMLSDMIEGKPYDIRCQALNHRVMARSMHFFENYELAIRLFLQSSEYYLEAGLEKSVFINEKFLANAYSQLEVYDEALAKLYAAEKAFIKYNDMDELYYVYIVAIKTYLKQNKLDSAQYYAKRAMESGNYTSDKQKMASIYNYLGSINQLKGNYREAIGIYDMIMQLDEGFFGSERAKAEACINLASSYNSIDEVQEAERYALQALEVIGNKPFIFLKYNAYKVLSDVHLHTDPLLSHAYMDSAQNYLERYHELSSSGIVDLVNTRFDLDGATRQIDQMEQDQKRNKLIFNFMLMIIVLFIVTYIIIFSMKEKITKTSMELVKKNITLMNQEKKVNKIIQEQKQFLADARIKPNLSNDQKKSILFHDFKVWLEEDKKFMDNDLNLNKAATKLGTNRSYLSNAINSQGINFPELINKYRIQEVIRIFENSDDIRNGQNLDEIATNVGFNTKSVFFESFRKETGMTPNQFRDYTYYNKIGNS